MGQIKLDIPVKMQVYNRMEDLIGLYSFPDVEACLAVTLIGRPSLNRQLQLHVNNVINTYGRVQTLEVCAYLGLLPSASNKVS